MKYLVVECHPSIVVLLDQEGRFFKAANLNYEVGEIVENPVLMDTDNSTLSERYEEETIKIPREFVKEDNVFDINERRQLKKNKEKKNPNRILRSIALIAAVFAIVFGITQINRDTLDTEVFVSMEMRINPAVNIDINREGKVIEVKGLNDDGETLVKGYKAKGKEKNQVVLELIDLAEDKGFFEDGDEISLLIDSPDREIYEEYGYEIRINIDEHLKNREYKLKIESKNELEDVYEIDDDTEETEEVDEEIEVIPEPDPKPEIVPPLLPVEDDDDDDDDDYYDDDDDDIDDDFDEVEDDDDIEEYDDIDDDNDDDDDDDDWDDDLEEDDDDDD